MKFILSMQCDDGWDNSCSYAFVHLSADEVKNALEASRLICGDVAGIIYYTARVQWFSSESSERNGDVFRPSRSMEIGLNKAGFLRVPGRFDPGKYTMVRVEMERMIVDSDGIHFTAYPRHGSSLFRTSDIPMRELKKKTVRRSARAR